VRQRSVSHASWTAGLCAGLALSCASTPARSGFLLDPGRTLTIASISYGGFSTAFDAAGALRRSAAFTKVTQATHVAYGLTDKVTLIGQLDSDRLLPQFINDPGASTSWSTLGGARLMLWRNDAHVVSVQALAGAGQSFTDMGFSADIRLLTGHSFEIAGMPAFGDLQVGYRHGAPGIRSELRFDATLGMRPHPDWLVLTQVFTAQALASHGLPAATRIKLQSSVVWDFSRHWSLQLGLYTTLFGINSVQENGAMLALWRRF
jgi:protein XagA